MYLTSQIRDYKVISYKVVKLMIVFRRTASLLPERLNYSITLDQTGYVVAIERFCLEHFSN